MNWTDGITCSVLRDGDAVAEVKQIDTRGNLWTYVVRCGEGVGVGTAIGQDAAKAAAERAIRRMRGEEEE